MYSVIETPGARASRPMGVAPVPAPDLKELPLSCSDLTNLGGSNDQQGPGASLAWARALR